MLSVGAIRFEDRSALAERVGQGAVGGCTALAGSARQADSVRQLLQLATERAWSALDGQFFCFLVQTSVENGPFTLLGLHFWPFGQLSFWRSVPWRSVPWRSALTIERSVMSRCGQGRTCKELLKEAVDQVSQANYRQKWKYR